MLGASMEPGTARWSARSASVAVRHAVWSMGPARTEHPRFDPATQRLQQEWSRASARLFAVYSERLAGKATQKELADAAAQARTARMAWSREAGPSVDLRYIETRQVFDVVRIRIEGGTRYLRGPLETHRRTLLETAASRAAGLPDEANRRVAVVSWPAGRDLHATCPQTPAPGFGAG